MAGHVAAHALRKRANPVLKAHVSLRQLRVILILKFPYRANE
jgi:hypothetical protein